MNFLTTSHTNTTVNFKALFFCLFLVHHMKERGFLFVICVSPFSHRCQQQQIPVLENLSCFRFAVIMSRVFLHFGLFTWVVCSSSLFSPRGVRSCVSTGTRMLSRVFQSLAGVVSSKPVLWREASWSAVDYCPSAPLCFPPVAKLYLCC